MSYRKIVSHNYNAEGIMYLKLGRYLEGIECFHKALSILGRNLDVGEKKNACTIEEGSSLDSSNMSSSFIPDEDSLVDALRSDPRAINGNLLFSVEIFSEDNPTDEHDDVYMLFNRALHCSLNEDYLEQRGSDLFSDLLAGALVYNLGLAHQLQGLRHGESKTLLRGLELYLIGYTCLKNRTISLLDDQQNPLKLCLLSISNNIVHILGYFRHFDAVGAFKDELSLRLSSSEMDDTCPELSDQEYKAFFFNAWLFREFSPVPASAA